VFLRDPLERFLSAFINKCETHVHEGHCEPTVLFQNRSSDILRGIKNGKQLMLAKNDKQRMFAAYVDTCPFSWNVHFFPQALYCNGLYRFLDNYDFVGKMDKSTFYNDLDELGAKFGGKFEEFLQVVFPVEQHLLKDETTPKNVFGGGKHKTESSNHVKEYYTASTLRRVLGYVAVDYIMLRLEIPDWANAMLQEDELASLTPV